MPAIEFYHPEEIHPSVARLVPNERTSAVRRSSTVSGLRGVLTLAGWTLDLGRSPKAQVSVSLHVPSLPVRSPEPPGGESDKLPGPLVCAQAPAIVVQRPGVPLPGRTWAWDQGRYKEPPCPHFPLGFTPGQTFEIFKGALAEALDMNIIRTLGLGDGVVQLDLEAKFAGPDPNGTQVAGWVGGTVWRGGWRMLSGEYRGWFIGLSFTEGPGTSGGLWDAWEFGARLHHGMEDLSGTQEVALRLALSGRWRKEATPPPPYSSIGIGAPPDPNANTGDWSWYRVCACPYQLAIWFDGASDTPAQTESAAPRSLFLGMPWAPEGFTGHNPFVFAANSILGVFRTQMTWPGYTQFDGKQWRENVVTVPCMRARHEGTVNSVDRVSNTQGAVLVENAYVCTEKNPSGYIGNHRLAGKLWNCAVLAQTYPCATVEADMLGGKWVHVSSHGWAADYSTLPGRGVLYGAQAASVWWKVESTSSAPPE